jgi:hypothetical protein
LASGRVLPNSLTTLASLIALTINDRFETATDVCAPAKGASTKENANSASAQPANIPVHSRQMATVFKMEPLRPAGELRSYQESSRPPNGIMLFAIEAQASLPVSIY